MNLPLSRRKAKRPKKNHQSQSGGGSKGCVLDLLLGASLLVIFSCVSLLLIERFTGRPITLPPPDSVIAAIYLDIKEFLTEMVTK